MSAVPAPSHLRCPVCRASLVGDAAGPAAFLRCPECAAAWIAPERFLSLGRGEVGPEDRALLAPVLPELRRPRTPFRDARDVVRGDCALCPVCGAPLRRAPIPDAGVTVGVCGGHGVAVRGDDFGRIATTIGIQSALRQVEPPTAAPEATPLPGRPLLLAGGAAFALSLALPSVELSIFRPAELPGIACLVLSPLTVVEQPLALPCVLGNLLVLLLPAISRRLTGGPGIAACIVALLAATSSWVLGAVVMGDDALVGYWVWFSAFLLVGAGIAARVGTPQRTLHERRQPASSERT